MKRRLAMILLGVCFTPLGAAACSCIPPGTVPQEKARSTRVFLGRVTAIEERTPQMDRGWLAVTIDWVKRQFAAERPLGDRDHPYNRVSFSVTQTFKGAPVQQLQLATGTGRGDCGYLFQTGRHYVVYAHGADSALSAGICSLTGPAADPRSGLAILRAGAGR
ncbi:hypothetical protein ACFQZQ_06100 [Lysobacter koreensis]|uniref:Lipoprotein n=1 Tax=Lysobacter koreensis TaxID=266122 RepID=A0ABW2YKB4_9GAMM